MDEAKRDLVRSWLVKSQHDLASARKLAAAPEPEVSPNLFNRETVIRYKVARAGQVKLFVFSDDGQLINTLIDAESAAVGFSVKWDGTDDKGQLVASGIYFLQAETPSYVASTTFEKVKSDFHMDIR